MRTIIDLPDADRAPGCPLPPAGGLSRAEGVRQALRQWLDQQTLDHEAMFGLWRDRGGTALEQERTLRQEWNP
ncbi:MAG: CopG family transcriptional regulator [Synechococcaceae cyanobacterium]|nr:CopG family transcriptional regulator [Synechococcaceae cyanobacterium]